MPEQAAPTVIEVPPGGDVASDAASEDDAHLLRGSSVYGASFNLANAALGAGILLFPSVYATVGCIPAVIAYFFVTGMMFFALHVLAVGAHKTQQLSYQSVMRDAISEKISLVIQISMTLYLVGTCVSFVVVVVDMTNSILNFHDETFIQRVTIATIGCAGILPLMLLKDISMLEFGSFVGVFVNVFSAFVIAVESLAYIRDNGIHEDFEWWKSDIGIGDLGSAMSTYTFANEMSLVFIPVYHTLEGKSIAKGDAAGLLAYIACLLCYIMCGVLGYAAYGPSVSSDILANNLPTRAIGILLARICLLIKSFVHYPVVHFPARLCLLDMWMALRMKYCSSDPDRSQPIENTTENAIVPGVTDTSSSIDPVSNRSDPASNYQRPLLRPHASPSAASSMGTPSDVEAAEERGRMSLRLAKSYVTMVEVDKQQQHSFSLPQHERLSLPQRLLESVKEQYASHVVTRAHVFRTKHTAMRSQLTGSSQKLSSEEALALADVFTAGNATASRSGLRGYRDLQGRSSAMRLNESGQELANASGGAPDGRGLTRAATAGVSIEQYRRSAAVKMQLGITSKLSRNDLKKVLMKNDVCGNPEASAGLSGGVSGLPRGMGSNRMSTNQAMSSLGRGGTASQRLSVGSSTFGRPKPKFVSASNLNTTGRYDSVIQEDVIQEVPSSVSTQERSAVGGSRQLSLVPTAIEEGRRTGGGSIAVLLHSNTFDGLQIHDDVVLDLEETTQTEYIVFTLLFLFVTWIATILFTNLGQLIDMVSALFGVPQVYLYPGIAWIKMMSQDTKYEQFEDEDDGNLFDGDARGGSASQDGRMTMVQREVSQRTPAQVWLGAYIPGGLLVVFGAFISIASVTQQIIKISSA